MENILPEAIERLLAAQSNLSAICAVTVGSLLPSDWNAVIISVGIEFTYKDGTKSIATQLNLNLHYGQKTTLYSLNNCVKSHLVVVRVQDPDQITALQNTYTANPGECSISNDIVIAPAVAISEEDFGKGKLMAVMK